MLSTQRTTLPAAASINNCCSGLLCASGPKKSGRLTLYLRTDINTRFTIAQHTTPGRVLATNPAAH